jgi:multidrug efflux pump subunit AcrA (membrane-fusion protein)
LLLTVNATGFVAAERSVRLSFETPGVIQQVLVEEGQRVEAGQILIRQDSTAQQLALKQAEAALDIARLTLEQLKAPVSEKDLAVADASVKAAEGAYNALLRSVDANAIKAAELRVQQASAAAEAATRRTKDIGGASDELAILPACSGAGRAGGLSLEIAKSNCRC